MPSKHTMCLLALLAGSLAIAPLTADTDSNQVLIVHDELPQMLVLANILSEKGGRYIALHHSISSKKAGNEFYFDFLGIQLDNPKSAKHPVMPGAGYGWREEVTLTLVNLNPGHYITSHEVDWGDAVPYTSSDQPRVEALCPSIDLHESEVYMNHKFTDGREKTVLCGFRFLDDRNGQMFMQDRAAWLKSYGEGEVVYFMPGHAASDFENQNFSQMIINAINWAP